MHSPVNHVASGMIFLHWYQPLIPSACYESLLASTLSARYSRGPPAGFLRHCRVKTWRLTVVAPLSLCARPLLTRSPQPAARKVIKVRTKNLPPQPSAATRHAPPPREPSPTLTGASQSGPSPARWAECMFACVELHPAAQHSD